MTYYLTLPFLLLFFVVFQHTVPGVLFLSSMSLEISLIIVVYAGFRLNILRGGILVLILGFIMDCIVGTISGFYTLIYFSLFSMIFLVSPRLYSESSSIVVIMTFISGILEGLLIVAFDYLIYGTHLFFDTFCFFFPQVIVLSFLSHFLFKFFDRFGMYHGGYARSAQ
ncbi:MAG: hypothetical protein PHN75_05120 [Syntrophales bacterium]|nr:hypothetical protein [Syntrophales bacterium]